MARNNEVGDTEIELVEEEDNTLPEPESDEAKFYQRAAVSVAKKFVQYKRVSEAKIANLEVRLKQVEDDRRQEHSELISMRDDSSSMSSEVDGLLRRDFNVNERVEANHLSLLSSVHKIEDAMYPKAKPNWLKFGWEFVALFFLFAVAFYEPFRTAVFANLAVVGVIALIGGYIVYSVNKNRRKRK